MAAIEEAEIVKLMVTRERGEFELDLDTFLEAGLTLSEGDASMARERPSLTRRPPNTC